MTSLPNIDPAELDRLLNRKRKRWGARRKQPTPSASLIPSVVASNNDDNDVLSDSEISIDPKLPPSAGTSSIHVYRWVVVMEHQRGFTLFNTPRYSNASLLPTDPAPFQVYDTTRQMPWAISSFEDYTLPSPLWLWISPFWMVDMRGDGEVDANGWQYGRNFTTLAWRSSVKSFSRGGWVRRRRWVRLMVKPASLDRSQPGMLPIGRSAIEDTGDVWKGKEDDWASCRRAIKTRPTDGQKLELWETWLADTRSSPIAQQQLGDRLDEILQTFVYPESRAQFLRLRNANLVLSDTTRSPTLEFWSYRELLEPQCIA